MSYESVVTLAEAKTYLRVVHDDDDALIQSLIDAAEQWAMRTMRTTTLEVLEVETDIPSVPEDVKTAIKLHVRSSYEETDPDKAQKWAGVAEQILYPYKASEICA